MSAFAGDDDVDAGREYWRSESGGLVADTLDWIAGTGWQAFFGRYQDFHYDSALEFRQRFLTRAMRGMT